MKFFLTLNILGKDYREESKMADLEEYLAIFSKCESEGHEICMDCRKCVLSKRIKFVEDLSASRVYVSICDIFTILDVG